MNHILQSFEYLSRSHPQRREQRIAATLLSASCIGNDGKSCPLFHSSFAPLLFSTCETDKQIPLQQLLLSSNNITWVKQVYFPDAPNKDYCANTIRVLTQKRYFPHSLKTIKFEAAKLLNLEPIRDFLWSFVKQYCHQVEYCTFNFLREDIADEHVVMLTCCIPRLKSFGLPWVMSSRLNCLITDKSFVSLSKLRHIQQLDFTCCTYLQDSHLGILSALATLNELYLRACSNITRRGIEMFLLITKTNSSHGSIQYPAPVADSIRSLSLVSCAEIDDETCRVIAHNCRFLDHLNLSWCRKVTDEGVIVLSKHLQFLRSLRLNNCGGVTDVALESLSHSSSLQHLDFSSCAFVTSVGLAHLGGSKTLRLKQLELASCNEISDQALLDFVSTPVASTLTYLTYASGKLSGAEHKMLLEKLPNARYVGN